MKVVTCVNDKGGSCKTTTIFNLASKKALDGYKVLMIDLDSCGVLSRFNDVDPVDKDDVSIGQLLRPDDESALIKRPEFKTSDILASIFIVDSFNDYVKKKYPTLDVAGNLCIIPTNRKGELIGTERRLSELKLSPGTVVKELIEKLDTIGGDKFDYVFIDCPGAMNILTLNALMAANYVIVPFEATKSNVDRFGTVFDMIGMVNDPKYNPDIKEVCVLPCRTKRRKTERTIIEEIDKEYQVAGNIKECADVTRYDDDHVAVVVAKPYCDASMAYSEVAEKL